VAGVKRFQDLVCGQLSRELKLAVYEFLERPLVRKDFGFCNQLREAARSAPRNIAEGFGRRTHADFARLLDIARGSLSECQNHLQDALDPRYLEASEFERLNSLAARASGATAALQRHLRS
jgi:four helix bundle protein